MNSELCIMHSLQTGASDYAVAFLGFCFGLEFVLYRKLVAAAGGAEEVSNCEVVAVANVKIEDFVAEKHRESVEVAVRFGADGYRDAPEPASQCEGVFVPIATKAEVV